MRISSPRHSPSDPGRRLLRRQDIPRRRATSLGGGRRPGSRRWFYRSTRLLVRAAERLLDVGPPRRRRSRSTSARPSSRASTLRWSRSRASPVCVSSLPTTTTARFSRISSGSSPGLKHRRSAADSSDDPRVLTQPRVWVRGPRGCTTYPDGVRRPIAALGSPRLCGRAGGVCREPHRVRPDIVHTRSASPTGSTATASPSAGGATSLPSATGSPSPAPSASPTHPPARHPPPPDRAERRSTPSPEPTKKKPSVVVPPPDNRPAVPMPGEPDRHVAAERPADRHLPAGARDEARQHPQRAAARRPHRRRRRLRRGGRVRHHAAGRGVLQPDPQADRARSARPASPTSTCSRSTASPRSATRAPSARCSRT